LILRLYRDCSRHQALHYEVCFLEGLATFQQAFFLWWSFRIREMVAS
jgi:hypothetical protein